MNYIIDREGKVVDAWYGGGREHPKAIAALRLAGGDLGGVIKRDLNAKVAKAAPEVAAAAKKLFQAIRTADYNHDWISTKDWEQFPAKDVDYCVDHNYPGWVRWVCRKFKANPITDVRLGQVFTALDGSPAVHFELRLKNGEVLQGDLPFRWYADKKQWIGWEAWTGTCTRRPGKKPRSRSRYLLSMCLLRRAGGRVTVLIDVFVHP